MVAKNLDLKEKTRLVKTVKTSSDQTSANNLTGDQYLKKLAMRLLLKVEESSNRGVDTRLELFLLGSYAARSHSHSFH